MKCFGVLLAVIAVSVNVIDAITPAPTPSKAANSTSSQKPTAVLTSTHSPSKNGTATTLGTTATVKPTSKRITNSPTDSPAPSPSPSISPSLVPTGTTGPTAFPSLVPTDSPAPSPAPSQTPSSVPSSSPSAVPSESPSSNPSSQPSMVPSSAPSSSPSLSNRPSLSPTSSMNPTSPTSGPSNSPSILPSISPTISPSTSPTAEMIVQSARNSVTFESLNTFMNADAQAVFEQQTKEFIQSQINIPSEVEVLILSVKLYEQTILPARRLTFSSMRNRRLQSTTGFRARYEVKGEVKPGLPPADFVFSQVTAQPFETNWIGYIDRLASAHEFFAPLSEGNSESNVYSSQQSENTGKNPNKMSAGGYVGVVLSVLGAVALAVVAAVYAFRARRRDTDTVSRGARLDLCNLDRCDSHSTALTPYGVVDSPGSMESGFYPGKAKDKESKEQITEMAKTKSLLDSMVNHSASSETEEQRLEGQDQDMGTRLAENVMASHATNSTRMDPPPSICGQTTIDLHVPTMGSSFCYSDDESHRSVELTPASAMNSPPGHAVEGTNDIQTMSVLGARPMKHSEKNNFKDTQAQEALTVKRSGLYDVFAPAGALGIVVDTTRDGPVVHSMKSTSPLLGLMSPGDLIVGLDDIDTRSMTAATLTRAMAKLSDQPERKITLLAVETTN